MNVWLLALMNMWRKLGYLSAFVLPLLVVWGYYMGGGFNFTNVIFVFLIIPIMDEWVGKDSYNISSDKIKDVSEDTFYRYVTYAWVYVQLGLILWACLMIARGTMNWLELSGLTLSVALTTGGIGITVAHELGHKKSALERFYAKVLLLSVCYMHFYIEHNRGHHVRVATPGDPATARRGESFYAFWLRAVFHGYTHAWHLENDRLERMGKNRLDYSNAMIAYTVLPIAFGLLLWLIFSLLMQTNTWQVPVFFFVQSILAFTLLELVDYIEHYGIVRKLSSEGKYERVNPLHSWNANHLISNLFLFQLQRHSDHHAYAIKRYQVLDHVEESPQLPAGYPAMILIALLPPLWFYLMDRRLETWKNQMGMGQYTANG